MRIFSLARGRFVRCCYRLNHTLSPLLRIGKSSHLQLCQSPRQFLPAQARVNFYYYQLPIAHTSHFQMHNISYSLFLPVCGLAHSSLPLHLTQMIRRVWVWHSWLASRSQVARQLLSPNCTVSLQKSHTCGDDRMIFCWHHVNFKPKWANRNSWWLRWVSLGLR